MSISWTLFVAILTIVNILACFWLLWWTRRRRTGGQSGEAPSSTTGHVWDEDLQEYNKPLPKWWLNLFYATIVFSVAYLVIYPGLGGFAGTKGWSQVSQHDADVAEARAKLEPLFARFRDLPLTELAKNDEALGLGRSVFANYCAQCHGSDARGAKGFPNLTDDDWVWGGDPDSVLNSILNGRVAVMPPWGQVLGEQGVNAVASYALSLSGAKVDAALAQAGKAQYDLFCVACHGADGRGVAGTGAPNLTDDIWLYGSDFDSVAYGIRNGRNGQMPAHRELLGEDRARLVAAWVLAQSAASGAAAGAR